MWVGRPLSLSSESLERDGGAAVNVAIPPVPHAYDCSRPEAKIDLSFCLVEEGMFLLPPSLRFEGMHQMVLQVRHGGRDSWFLLQVRGLLGGGCARRHGACVLLFMCPRSTLGVGCLLHQDATTSPPPLASSAGAGGKILGGAVPLPHQRLGG